MAEPPQVADDAATPGSEPDAGAGRRRGGPVGTVPEAVPGIRLVSRGLFALRAAWLLVATILVGLATVGFVRAFRTPHLVALPALTDLFTEFGLNLRAMLAIVLVTPFVVVVLISVIVFWRRSDDPMALLFTMALLALYTFGSRSMLTYEPDSLPGQSVPVVFALAMVCLAFVIANFPDGRPAPRSARWLVVGMVLLLAAFPDAGRTLVDVLDGEVQAGLRVRVLVALFSALLVVGLLAQVHRYRRVSGPTERQQTKWVVMPLGLQILVSMAGLGLTAASPENFERWVGWLLLIAMIPVSVLLPVMVANAILRYRLYEIDRIISRTVSYGLLTGLLAVVYLVAVIGLQQLLRPVTGESQLAVAGATLVVAASFQPARRRIQAAVDRRFDRARYDAQRTVESFRLRLRDKLDIDELTSELAATTDAAVAPARVHVWLPGRRAEP